MEQVNIIQLVEKNPITRLSKDYENRLINKVKETFTDVEQQMFLASFYCFLNYDVEKDFVIDFDVVWKWLGFTRKNDAKRLLEKHFTIDIDYNIKKISHKREVLNPENYFEKPATATSVAGFETENKVAIPPPLFGGAGSEPENEGITK